MKKSIRYIAILILLKCQLLFLGTIIKEKYQEHIWISVGCILLVSLFLFITFIKAPLHHHQYDKEDSLVAIWVPIGAVICYFLSVGLQLGNVIAAGITGTIASFLPSLKKSSFYLKKLPTTIYCGAFVGMSSTSIAPSFSFVLAAGILAGILLLYSKSLFLGIGGKLGLIAFSSVFIISLLLYLLK